VKQSGAQAVELSIALPAYEEAANLAVLLPQLKGVLEGLGVRHEILVVDTEQPRDATPQVCAEHGVRYLPRTGGSLYSDAVRTAIRASTGRWVIFMDADGSHSPSFVTNLWAEREAADVIIASRYIAGGKTENPAVLILLSLAVNVVFRVVLGLDCSDVSNSFRLYRGDDLRALTLECQNFDIVEEMLVKLCFTGQGRTVKEIPFTFEQRKAGKTKRDLVSFATSYLTTLGRLYRMKRQARREESSR
jgi:dolichol-phosphate mannosyltransferase